MSESTWLSEDQQRIWRAFLDMNHQLAISMERQLAQDSQLSGADYQVLVSLSEAPGGAMRAGELGRTVGWERSRLSHQIRRMTQRDLVEKRECSSDARGIVVVITGHGRAKLAQAAPGHVAHVRSVFFDALTARDLGDLARIARKVRRDAPASKDK